MAVISYHVFTCVLCIILQMFLTNADVCNGAANGAYLADPTDCAKYYICYLNSGVSMTCGPGLYWDTSRNTCNHAYMVDCVVENLDTTRTQATALPTSSPTNCAQQPCVTEWSTATSRPETSSVTNHPTTTTTTPTPRTNPATEYTDAPTTSVITVNTDPSTSLVTEGNSRELLVTEKRENTVIVALIAVCVILVVLLITISVLLCVVLTKYRRYKLKASLVSGRPIANEAYLFDADDKKLVANSTGGKGRQHTDTASRHEYCYVDDRTMKPSTIEPDYEQTTNHGDHIYAHTDYYDVAGDLEMATPADTEYDLADETQQVTIEGRTDRDNYYHCIEPPSPKKDKHGNKKNYGSSDYFQAF